MNQRMPRRRASAPSGRRARRGRFAGAQLEISTAQPGPKPEGGPNPGPTALAALRTSSLDAPGPPACALPTVRVVAAQQPEVRLLAPKTEALKLPLPRSGAHSRQVTNILGMCFSTRRYTPCTCGLLRWKERRQCSPCELCLATPGQYRPLSSLRMADFSRALVRPLASAHGTML